MTTLKQIHISHIIYALKTGGLENGLVNLINNLPKETFKHSIICLTESDSFADRIKRQDVEIISLHKKPGQDIGLYIKLYKVLKRLRPDVVHTRNMTSIEAQIPAFFSGVKVRVHGEHGWDVSDPQGKNKKYQWIRKICSMFIHRFIPLSKELECYLNEVIHIPSKKITRICNGVDVLAFSPKNKNTMQVLGGEKVKNKVVIGYVGRMERIKNPENLVKAFIQLHKKNIKDIFLVMIGEGRELTTVKNLLVAEQLTEQCWLPGDCKNVAELLQNFDIFCLPSKAEGISNTLLEAMATGLPVVATKVGGNADIVLEDKTALLVDSDDTDALANALERYVKNKELRIKHGKAGRQRIENSLSLQQMVLNYQTMYLKETNKLQQEVA